MSVTHYAAVLPTPTYVVRVAALAFHRLHHLSNSSLCPVTLDVTIALPDAGERFPLDSVLVNAVAINNHPYSSNTISFKEKLNVY